MTEENKLEELKEEELEKVSGGYKSGEVPTVKPRQPINGGIAPSCYYNDDMTMTKAASIYASCAGCEYFEDCTGKFYFE